MNISPLNKPENTQTFSSKQKEEYNSAPPDNVQRAVRMKGGELNFFLPTKNSSDSIQQEAPCWPSFKGQIEITEAMKQKVAALLPLFPNAEEKESERLLETVKYVEKNRESLIEITSDQKSRGLYIHPDKDLEPRPYHIQVHVKEDGAAAFYILPKSCLLGQGAIKHVRLATDYIYETYVACATIKLTKNHLKQRTDKEYQLQKKYHMVYHRCLHSRTSEKKRKVPKVNVIMPCANFGSLERCTEPAGHHEFTDFFDKAQRILIIRKIFEFVSKVHKDGYVIADLKPANILIKHGENQVEVLISDLNLAYHENACKAAKGGGSPFYLGPEYVESFKPGSKVQVGKPSDIYALGLTIWEVFVGGIPPWLIDPIKDRGIFLSHEKYMESYQKADPYEEGGLENLIYRMMHPFPSKRPAIDAIIEENPSLALSTPTYKGMRLLTQFESNSRHISNFEVFLQTKKTEAFPPDNSYVLMQGEQQDSLIVHSSERIVEVKLEEDDTVQVYLEGQTAPYDSLEDFLKENDLKYCLNHCSKNYL